MSTSAGVEFKAPPATIKLMNKQLDELDNIVNNGGLRISCSPVVQKVDKGRYKIYGQTHWDYSGQNGERLVFEIKKWMEWHMLEVDIVEEWYD